MKNFILLSCFLLFGNVYAQKRQNVYFFNKNYLPVDTKDSADIIRVVMEPDSGTSLYGYKEFYKNGKPKAIGKVSKFEPQLIREGQIMEYNDEGMKQSLVTYVNNNPAGQAYYYYGSGLLNKIVDYSVEQMNVPMELASGSLALREYKLIHFADESGKILVADGNGHLINRYKGSDDDELTEEGDYVNGLKAGMWSMKNTDNTHWYKEQYDNGKLVTGQSFKEGKSYSYNMVNQLPSVKGGMETFYSFLRRNVKYPSDAQKLGITGRVFLTFVIEKDGTIAEIKVARKLFPSLDEESVRVMQRSPKWNPGLQRGIPVRVKYNIPINFSL